MGIYYAWTCDHASRTLHILPHESCKLPSCAVDTLAVLAELCQAGSWKYMPVRIVNDMSGDFYDPDDPFNHRPPPDDLAACIARVNEARATHMIVPHPLPPIPMPDDDFFGGGR